MRALIKQPLMLLTGLLILSCGEGSNFNKIVANDKKLETASALLNQAERKYDERQYAEARTYAEKALAMNEENEDAAILLSYISLAEAGVETFTLAKRMLDIAEGTSDTSNCDGEDGAVEALCQIEAALSIDSEVLESLSSPASDLHLLSSEIRYPLPASDARAAGVMPINKVNNAINYTCRYVDAEAKIDGDDRHQDDTCVASVYGSQQSSKVHFLWSLSHLVEGIYFYSVFQRNLTLLAAELTDLQSSGTTTDIGTFIQKTAQVSLAVDNILPTGDAATGSMLTAILNNLNAVSAGFAAIDGMPDKLKKTINDAIAELEKKAESVSGQSASQKGTEVLKNEFTTRIATEVTSQLNDGQLSELQKSGNEAKKTEFCDAYSKISSDKLVIDSNGKVQVVTSLTDTSLATEDLCP